VYPGSRWLATLSMTVAAQLPPVIMSPVVIPLVILGVIPVGSPIRVHVRIPVGVI